MHMKNVFNSYNSLSQLILKFPNPIVYFDYKIEEQKDIELNSLQILNPEKFYKIFENQETSLENIKLIEYFEKNPENWYHQIIEKDQPKWKKNLMYLPKQKSLKFSLRIYDIPKFLFPNNNSNFDITLFCHLILLEKKEEKNQTICSTLCVFEDITSSLYLLRLGIRNSPHGFFLYRDTFEFVNERFCQITGYQKEELLKMPIWEIVHPRFRPEIQKIVELRLSGKVFNKIYKELPVITKLNQIKWVRTFASTVYLKGKPYGLGILLDKTKEKNYLDELKRIKKFYSVFGSINEVLIKRQRDNVKELFLEIVKILTRSFFEFVWVGRVDLQTKEIQPFLYDFRQETYKEYLKDLKINIEESSPYSKGPSGQAFLTNEIQINNNSKKNLDMEPWKERLLKFNFLSSASLPIETPKEQYTINLYSKKANFFKKEIIDLLKRLKDNLETFLYNQYTNEWLQVYSYVLENTDLVFIVTDLNNKILYINSYTEKLYGYTLEEVYLQDPKIFSSYLHPKEFSKKLWDTILQKKVFKDLFINRKKNGELVYVQQTIIPIVIDGNISYFIALGIDLTNQFLFESSWEVKLLFDPVTKLPTLNFLKEQIKSYLEMQMISNASNIEDIHFCILNIDLVGFHYINDGYGNHIGDLYLKAFSKILQELLISLKLKFILSRRGSDEFLIFLASSFSNSSEDRIILFLNQVVVIFLSKLKEVCKKNHKILESLELNFSYHCGISLFPDDFSKDQLTVKENNDEWISSLISKMIQNSEAALFEAKKEQEFTYKFYHPKMESYTRSFIFIKQNIYNAIQNNEFVLYYQPYFNVKTMEIKGAEVLVRWQRNGEMIPPNYFIPYLEQTGQIIEVENVILDQAIEFYKRLLENNKPIHISLNITPITLLKTNFVQKILEKKEILGFDGKYLTFEITETSLIENFQKVEEIIYKLKEHDFSFALDDFGKGYSSLSYLESLPIDIIKIDRSLIQDIHLRERKRILVETIAQLSEKLKFISFAEGVEKKEEFEWIKTLNISYVQGFLFAKPMPESEFLKIL